MGSTGVWEKERAFTQLIELLLERSKSVSSQSSMQSPYHTFNIVDGKIFINIYTTSNAI